MDIFMGSGTTVFECEKLERNCIGFDINQTMVDFVKSKMEDVTSIQYYLNECDVTNTNKFSDLLTKNLLACHKIFVDFVIAHPPYMDIVKFTDKPEDLSQISDLNVFIEKILLALDNAITFLSKNKYFAIVIGDVYKRSEVIPLGFYVMNAIKKNFKVRLKGILVKNIEGNRGKLGTRNIWKYRALKSDYFLFKHEYIFVFKKEF